MNYSSIKLLFSKRKERLGGCGREDKFSPTQVRDQKRTQINIS
jgi:hypothetical protein